MIAARQTDFIGKMIQGPPDQPSQNMITECCDHKRGVRRPQTTGKIFMIVNLRLLFQDVNTVTIDRFGSLQNLINEANNEGYCSQFVKRLLHPDKPIPERPETWGPIPLWHARRAAGGRCPSNCDTDNNDDDDDEGNSNDSNDNRRHRREGHHDESRRREQHQSPPSPRRSPPMHEQ